MINYKVHGRNLKVTPSMKEYAIKRISKIERYFEDDVDSIAHINFKVYPNKSYKTEVTIPLPYLTLRAEETSKDLYASIDLTVDKIDRQIKKYKTRVNHKARQKGYKHLDFETTSQPISQDDNQPELKIVRTKSIDVKPMSVDEAILQMKLLNHSFFIFKNAKTNETNIVYQRDHGQFGLITAA